MRGWRGYRHTLEAKLDARIIRQPSGCWEVQGHALPNGYVQISSGSRWTPPYIRVGAHVLAWERANGQPVPKGLVVMHSCDNPRCANPAHLSVGTQRQNIIDSIHKGRYNCFGIQKLNAEQVREIRALAARGLRQKDIAARFGIARNTVSGIVHRKTWDHVSPFDPSVDNVERVPTPAFVELPIRGDLHVGDSATSAIARQGNQLPAERHV